MTATHYYSASKDELQEIAAMAYPHLVNAIKKIERGDGSTENGPDVLKALKAEVAKRDHDAAGLPAEDEAEAPWDEEMADVDPDRF